MRNSTLRAKGGLGGSGSQWTPPGLAAAGGNAWLSVILDQSFTAETSEVSAIGGDGGSGGPSGDVAGADGGRGASATLSLTMPLAMLTSSLVSVNAGDGGAGGAGDESGGSGGVGESSSLFLKATGLTAINTVISSSGGNGGVAAGSHSAHRGGAGAIGGPSTLSVDVGSAILDSVSAISRGGTGSSAYDSRMGSGNPGGGGGDSNALANFGSIVGTSLGIICIGGIGGKGGASTGQGNGANGADGGDAATSLIGGHWQLASLSVEASAGFGGNGGNSATQNAGHAGSGGSASMISGLADLIAGVVSTTVSAGFGGDGGSYSGPYYNSYYGGNGGNGGQAIWDWNSIGSTEASTMTIAYAAGAGGAAGIGNPAGVPGVDGTEQTKLKDGYAAFRTTGSTVALQTLLPNLLTVKSIATLSLDWDGGAVVAVTPSQSVPVPSVPGLHTLKLNYSYADGTSATSTHGILVLGSDSDFDADGIKDLSEVNSYNTDPGRADTDRDGLADGQELANRTNPLEPDTDHDGVFDGSDPSTFQRPDLVMSPNGPTYGSASPIEGSSTSASIQTSNADAGTANGVTVAFLARTLPTGPEVLVGSDFIAALPASASEVATTDWSTAGFTGEVQVRAVLDPFNRLLESNEANNSSASTLTVLSRPDVQISAFDLSDDEPVTGETVTIDALLLNSGDTPAGSQTTALYSEAANSANSLVGESIVGPMSAGMSSSAPFNWIAAAPGAYRLLVRADRNNEVGEDDEGNNDAWRDVFVGIAGPVLLDSGTASDSIYTSNVGYGVIDEGQPDIQTSCGSEPHQTVRRDPTGRIVYRFDHLQPGHYYHLDTTMYECVATGRNQSLFIDGNLVAGPIDLGDGEIHRLSILVDPVMYADRSVTVSIEDSGIDGAIVSEVNLHDIDFRYADSGGSGDVAYDPGRGYGWLDGVSNRAWGTLPSQSVRVDQDDNELRYRFDKLDPTKSYQLRLTFWQPSGQEHIQKVLVNGIDVGISVDTGDYLPHVLNAPIPIDAYQGGDHSIIVSIVRLNGDSGAMINEIALEAQTSEATAPCAAIQTPYRMDVHGSVTINGQPAPTGTTIQAVDPRGNTVGCFTTSSSGQYGFMPVFGEDTSRVPSIPGMRSSELMTFRVNGVFAVATPLTGWQHGASVQINLDAGAVQNQSIALRPGWNLLSTHIEPLLPPLKQALASISSRYDRVLGENGVYAPLLDDVYNSLTDLTSGAGYYIRTTDSATTYLLVQGVPSASDKNLTLHTGWNWIGYLPITSLPVATALQSITGKFQRVISIDKAYDPLLPDFNTLQQMMPGEGYLVYMNQAATLSYPTAGLSAFEQVSTDEPQTTINCAGVKPTPYSMLVYGSVLVGGLPASTGTVVEVLNPAGEIAGCIVTQKTGKYGFMHVYGVDESATPLIPGFSEAEEVRFRVNGVAAEVEQSLTWQDDKAPHRVDLKADFPPLYLPAVIRNNSNAGAYTPNEEIEAPENPLYLPTISR